MDRNFLINLCIMICLVLVQVLICNHILLFHCAMAFVFIYVIIRLPLNLKTNYLLTWAFFGGLAVDLFSDTIGVNALACTLLAIIKRPVLFSYIPRDDRTKNIEPSLYSLGFAVYGKYLLTMVSIYCFLAFTIEYFNFAAVKEIAIMTAGSSIFTFMVILGIDSLIVRKQPG